MRYARSWKEYQTQCARDRRERTHIVAHLLMAIGVAGALTVVACCVFGCSTVTSGSDHGFDADSLAGDLLPQAIRLPPSDLGGTDTADVPRILVDAAADGDLASPPKAADLAPVDDLSPAPTQADLSPTCTRPGVTCSGDVCCLDPLPTSIDNDAECREAAPRVCCAFSKIGVGCDGGRFKWCKNCGQGWTCGLCT